MSNRATAVLAIGLAAVAFVLTAGPELEGHSAHVPRSVTVQARRAGRRWLRQRRERSIGGGFGANGREG